MSGYPQQQLGPLGRLAAKVAAAFTSDRVVTRDGVGGNVVDLLGELVRAIDANTEQIRRFNDRRDREDGV